MKRLAEKEGVNVENLQAYWDWVEHRMKNPGMMKDVWLQRPKK